MAGACLVLFSGGTMVASDAGCPPWTVSCTLVSVTFCTRLAGDAPAMVGVNSALLTGDTALVPVTLLMLTLRIAPTAGWFGQECRSPIFR